jgi:ankyrin repeat protein
MLLCHNADFSIRDNDGRAAIDFAKNSDHKLFENQIRWNRRKALMIMLAENGYIHSPSSTSLTISGPPLRFDNVFSNEGLLRLIVGYL